MRRSAKDGFLIFLGHATENANYPLRMALLVATQHAERAVNLVLGMLPYAACIEENDIRIGRLVRQLISLPAQAADDELAVQHVHLVADGFDVELLGGHLIQSPRRT